MLVFKRFTFEAAHALPQYPGIHGHSYTVEVRVRGPAGADYAIVEDEFTRAVDEVRRQLDHRLLNDVIAVPTSENIARHIWRHLAHQMALAEVRVWRESMGFGAIYRGEAETAEDLPG